MRDLDKVYIYCLVRSALVFVAIDLIVVMVPVSGWVIAELIILNVIQFFGLLENKALRRSEKRDAHS